MSDNTVDQISNSTPLLARLQVALPRIGAMLLLLAVIGVIWFFGFRPYQQAHQSLNIEIDGKAKQLSRVQAIIARAGKGDANVKAGLAVETQGDYLAGDDRSLIMADLQTRIGQIIANRNGTLVQAKQLEDVEEFNTVKTGLNVQLRGSIKDVYLILHDLEASRPFLFIEKVDMQIFGDPSNTLLSSGKIPAQLLVDVDVRGYLLPQGASAK